MKIYLSIFIFLVILTQCCSTSLSAKPKELKPLLERSYISKIEEKGAVVELNLPSMLIIFNPFLYKEESSKKYLTTNKDVRNILDEKFSNDKAYYITNIDSRTVVYPLKRKFIEGQTYFMKYGNIRLHKDDTVVIFMNRKSQIDFNSFIKYLSDEFIDLELYDIQQVMTPDDELNSSLVILKEKH
jgi:hypothetical protein